MLYITLLTAIEDELIINRYRLFSANYSVFIGDIDKNL